jgi:cellulose synthase/poly-beta-1,6-N-acetylglucosamine synthase-like glycosyltransferase
VWLDDLAIEWGNWIATVLLGYSVVAFASHLALGLLALAEGRRQRRHQLVADPHHLFESEHAPAISVLVPAFNDEPTIAIVMPAFNEEDAVADSVRSLLTVDYPHEKLEIVVVNDGSTDDTLDRLIQAFDLRSAQRAPLSGVPRARVREVLASPHHPLLTVLDVVRGRSRARAANFGIAYARHPLVLVMDANSVLERDTLVQLALPFYEDAQVAGVGCVVRPSNGSIIERGHVKYCALPASRFACFQVVEYLRGMLSHRLAWGFLDSLFVHPGMIGLFSREAVRAVGGFRTGATGEDMDLCMRLQRRAARSGQRSVVRFLGGAVAWTAVPESLGALARQRARWYQGLAEALWFNRALLFSGRIAIHHSLAFLFLLLVDLIGPVIEAVGQAALIYLAFSGNLDTPVVIIYFSVFVVGGTIPSLLSIALERKACPRFERSSDLEGLALYALLENLGYRQLTVVWRVVGMLKGLIGRRSWGEMPRSGRETPADEADAKQAA